MIGNQLFVFLMFASYLNKLECRFGAIKHVRSNPQSKMGAGKHRGHNSTKCKHDGIAQFLCTEEPIWLYSTSSRTDRECEVDQKKSMSSLSIIVFRSYYSSGKKISGDIEGKFDPKNDKRMYLEIPSTAKVTVQKLAVKMTYMSQKLRCAVFKITTHTGSHITYDLRVRNSSITQGPSQGCIRHFEDLSKHSSLVYHPSCQKILGTENRPQLILYEKGKTKNNHL
ncbi:uncharacterized protein LOC142792545 [Rhipicephalus microplus]|uniref:uncharacterized protein LOC142792545 n=1 Tax=Rhipicephalus microplus TaxID=6941 RepID=UPI003F6C9D8E